MAKQASKLKGYDNVFAQRLRTLMEKRHFTQDTLAEKAGCSRQAISQYMDGSSAPNVDKLLSIAKFFNVSTDYLLGLSDTPTNDKDLQFVCEYTGLSETAVATLRELDSEWNLLHLVPGDIRLLVDFLITDMHFQLTDKGCSYRRGSILPSLLDYLRCAGYGSRQEVFVTQNGKVFETNEKALEETKKLPGDIKQVYTANAADLAEAAFYKRLTDAITSAKERYGGKTNGNDQQA